MTAFTPTAGPDGSVNFVGIEHGGPAAGPAALQPAGRLYRVAADGTGLTPLGEPGGRYLSPRYETASGRLVAYGDGPVAEATRMANGTPFTWPGAVRAVRVGDRCLRLHAMRSYFPSVDERTGRVVAVQWVHERNGLPAGPSPIVSAALDGTDLRAIHTASDSGFMWSPVVARDGEWVFFSTGARFGAVDDDVGIWKVRTVGSGTAQLTAGSAANDAMPDVSADGRWVVFRSGRDGKPGSGRRGVKEIYVMDSDGGQLRRVTHAGGINTMPAISPDGSRVVFPTTRTGVGWKLWTRSLTDPADEGRLLEPDRARLDGRDMHPRFSPDGRWIVFTSDRAGYMDEIGLSGMFPQPYGELYAVPVDGSGPAVRLTHDKWEDALAHWAGSPR
jgi:dipeptidyl aminopeptidase/acylaminoacyl peptidase